MGFVISPYIFIPLTAWLVAQLLKYLLIGMNRGSLTDLRLLYKSGDMPSSHAAITVALLVVVGVLNGTASALFGVVAVITGIVLYDAVNVRRSVGEQGRVLQKLLSKSKKELSFHTAKGHTFTEVIVGSLIGFTVAVLMLQLL